MNQAAATVTTGGLVSRLRKVEGQVRGLQHMVDQDEACVDILAQVAAARAALTAVSFELIAYELGQLVATEDPEERAAAAGEVLAAVRRIGTR